MSTIKKLLGQLEQKDIELAKERQSKKALESKSSNQILKLAENNASLARLNNALSNQLEKLRGEHERLLHLSTGQQAVAKAKSVELIEEIDGLKKLLKESQEEKEALRSHLNAKQEIICYLECLLGQAQPFRDKCVRKSFPLVATVDGTKATAARIIPGEGIYNDAGDTFSPYVDNIGEHTEVKNGATGLWDLGPNSLAVSIATQMEKIQGYDSGCSNKENMAQQQQHRFSTRTKDSIGIPAEDYPCEHVENEQDAADTTQKNSFRDLALLGINQVRTPFSEITPFLRESNGSSTLKGKQLQFLSSRDCVHSLSNISGDAECSNMTPGSNPIESVQNHGSTSLCGESSSSQGYERFNSRHPRGKKSVKAVQTDDSQNPSFERKEPEPSSHGVPCPESKGGTLKTPQAVETGCNGFSPASTNVKQLIGKLQEASGPRSLGRRASCRTPRVSYTLPRLNSKLRQGDPFTFGDPSILPRKSKESVSVKKKNRYFVSGKVEPR